MVTLEQQVLQAKRPRDALLLLARAIDALRSAPTLESWDGWVPDEAPAAALERAPVQGSVGDRDPTPPVPRINPEDLTDDVVRAWISKNYKNGVILEDTPDAKQVIAQVRDDMLHAPNVATVEELFRTTTEGIVESRIDWAPLNEKHYKARHAFAQRVLNLDVALGPHPMGGDWADDYAKGGPMWFYIPNRDLVMQYPESVRSQMVDDVRVTTHERLDQPAADKVTHEFGADVLKKPMSTDLEPRGAPQPVGLREDQF